MFEEIMERAELRKRMDELKMMEAEFMFGLVKMKQQHKGDNCTKIILMDEILSGVTRALVASDKLINEA
jgi:hypothetical protein